MLLAMFYIERASGSELESQNSSLLGPKLGQKPERWHTLVGVVIHVISGISFVLATCLRPDSSQAWFERESRRTVPNWDFGCSHHGFGRELCCMDSYENYVCKLASRPEVSL